MRSAQISILAPKLVISSNFFRGGLDKFSALNGVFLAKNQQLSRDLPHRFFFSFPFKFYVTDLHRMIAVNSVNRPGELCD